MAPQFVADPKVSRFRPFRDTRFSPDKTPLKTHVAAIFPQRALGRLRGAGLYFEVGPGYVWIGGGLYAPDPASLHAVREHIAARHARLRKLLAAAPFVRTFGSLSGERAARMPRGFAAEHPAADLIRHKQFLAVREEADVFATSADFYPQLLASVRRHGSAGAVPERAADRPQTRRRRRSAGGGTAPAVEPDSALI